MSVAWPDRPQVIAMIRTILRRQFGAQDAWVIAGRTGVRLEARIAGGIHVLLAASEASFWPRFYKPVIRERRHLGEVIAETVIRRKSGDEVAAVLAGLWAAAQPAPRAAASNGAPPD